MIQSIFEENHEIISNKTRIPIDLKCDYLKNSFSSPQPFQNILNFKELETIKINNFNVLSPNPEDLLLTLCINNAQRQWDYLSLVVDIAALINSTHKLNWKKIMQKSKNSGFHRILLINLILTKNLFNIKLPKPILNEIESDKLIKNVSVSISKKFFSKNDFIVKKYEKSLLRFKIRENISDGYKDFNTLLKSRKDSGIRVPFYKTPPEVIKRMLEIANVRPNDTLYDLGCGDGDIIITAAKEYGVNGVGIDNNPQRIKEANINAEKEGVKELTTFVQQDIMKADISNATLVTLYLLPSVNIKIRPKLKNQLKPGARIVSRDFDMGKWIPFRSEIMFYKDIINTIYLWKI